MKGIGTTQNRNKTTSSQLSKFLVTGGILQVFWALYVATCSYSINGFFLSPFWGHNIASRVVMFTGSNGSNMREPAESPGEDSRASQATCLQNSELDTYSCFLTWILSTFLLLLWSQHKNSFYKK